MNDPWENIRHTLSVMPAQSLIPDPIMGFLVADGKKLLADADALMALKMAVERFKADSWTFDPKHVGLTTWGSVLLALADLPSYLKGK